MSQELTSICNICRQYYDSNETVGTNHTFRNLSDGNSVATPVPNSFTLLSNAKETWFQQTSRTKLGATIVVSNPLSKSVYNIWPKIKVANGNYETLHGSKVRKILKQFS